jgi:hypothetical protein
VEHLARTLTGSTCHITHPAKGPACTALVDWLPSQPDNRGCASTHSTHQHVGPCRRRYNWPGNSRLLALPLDVQYDIFHRAGREVREVCLAARACYGPAGGGVEVQVPAPESMLRQLQAWPCADAVQRLRVVPISTIDHNDPALTVNHNDPALTIVASAFPRLQELTSLVPLRTSLQLLPATLTSLRLGCAEDSVHLAHLTALRSLHGTGRNPSPHCSLTALTALTFTHSFDPLQEFFPAAAPPFLPTLPASLQRLVLKAHCSVRDSLQQLQHLKRLTHLEVDARMLRIPAAAVQWPPPHLASLQSLALRAGPDMDMGHGPRPDIRQRLQALPLESLQLLQVPSTHSLKSYYLPDTSSMPTLTSLAVDFSDSNGHLDTHHVADAEWAPFTTTPCNVASFSLRGALSALPVTIDCVPAMLPYLTDLHLDFMALHTGYSSSPPFHRVSQLTGLQRLALHSHSVPSAILSHLATLSRLSFLDLTQPRAEHHPLLPRLTQLRRLKLAVYPLQPCQLAEHPRVDGVHFFGAVRRTADGLLLGEAIGNCLAAVRQMRGLTELDLAGLPDRQPMGLRCLLPVPVLLQRVRVPRGVRAEALAVLGPHVDDITSS